MLDDLSFDLVELAHCAEPPQAGPLREVAFRGNAWLPEEDDRLRTLFAADMPVDAIADQLRRGRAGVSTRLCELGLRRNTSRPWSELEDQLLVERYGKDPAATLALELGRGCSSVYIRAAKLGLSEACAPPYSAWEDAQVRAGYESGVPPHQIGLLIGRTLFSVRSRAHKLGVTSPFADQDWTQEELDRLLDLAVEGHRYLEIIERLVAEGFPRRTKAGLGPKLRQLGYRRGWGRRWTAEEDDLLRHCYATGASLTPLKEGLGRTTCSIRWRVKELGLQGTHAKTAGWRTEPVWTEAEEQILRDRYGKVKTRELAAELGRSRMATLNRAWHLGLKHGYWRPYTEDELRAYRIAFDEGVAIADLAIALERSAFTVSKYATDKLGLHFGRRPRRRPPLTLAEILELPLSGQVPAAAPPVAPRRRGGVRPCPARADWRDRRDRVSRVLERRVRSR